MKHIRYISDNKTICSKPTRLGHDFVVIDTEPHEGDTCLVCSDLLFAHNMEEYNRESALYKGVLYVAPPPALTDDHNAVKGIAIGLAVSSFFWILVFSLFLMVFN